MDDKDPLLDQIEIDLLAGKPLSDLLRAIIIYGGRARSQELINWAREELNGYGEDDELPEHRKVLAPLVCDWSNMAYMITAAQISHAVFPDDLEELVPHWVPFTQSLGEIESLVERNRENGSVNIGIPYAAAITDQLNIDRDDGVTIHRVYWSVSVSAIEGILDRARTKTAALLSELRKQTPRDSNYPTPEQANRALQNTFTGDNNTINFTQATDSATATTNASSKKTISTAAKSGIGVAILGLLTAAIALVAKLL